MLEAIERCDNCDAPAVWFYMPGDYQRCDEHVHRGCSCNHRYVSPDAYHPPLKEPDAPYSEGDENIDWKWLSEEKTHWCRIDSQGREWPCCEWDYDGPDMD